MRKKAGTLGIVLLVALPVVTYSIDRLPGVWCNWRGPMQNGASDETGYPTSWSPKGENLIWKAPIGGRSAPVVYGDRLYIVNSAGEGELEQEQLISLDANTGSTSNGTKLIIWNCHGGQNQQWRLNPDGSIGSVQSGKCVDVTGGDKPEGNVNGTQLELYDCNDDANQAWSLKS